jgi:hypothetical protein
MLATFFTLGPNWALLFEVEESKLGESVPMSVRGGMLSSPNLTSTKSKSEGFYSQPRQTIAGWYLFSVTVHE